MADKPYLCLVGTSPSTTRNVPHDDPLAAVWGTGAAYAWTPKCAAWFEMHTDAEIDRCYGQVPEVLRFLEGLKVPLLMTHKCERFPMSVAFPLAEAQRFFGLDFFHSTFDYMLSLAIMQMSDADSPFRKEIRLFGIDLHPNESYGYQLASASFYLGWAEALGIEVVIPESSSLLYTGHRYGYDDGIGNNTSTDDRIRALEAEVVSRIEGVRQEEIRQAAAQGRLEEAKLWGVRRRF